jgi:hypothetical protein
VALPNTALPLPHIEVDFTAGPPNLVGANRKSLNATALRKTAVTKFGVARGRQYELDQVQAGTCDVEVVDPLEVLNPLNGSSPFMSGGNSVKPYRAMRVAAMWPVGVGSGNIINTGVDSTYDAGFESGVGGWARAGGTTTVSQSSAQAWQGTKSLLVTQSASGAGTGVQRAFRTAPGITYVFSCYVYVTGGAVKAQVTAADGTVVSSATVSTLNTWTRISMSWISFDTLEPVVVYNTTNTSTFYVDGTQLEFGTSPTTFTTSGPTLYDIYNGYVERYPLKYDMAGSRGVHPLTCVDALAILSRTIISQSYASTILADTPALFMPLNDSAVPQVVQRPTGGAPMLGYTNQGTNGQVQWGGDSFLDGTSAVQVGQQNASPPVSGDPNYITYLGTRNGALSMNPQAFTLEMWVKVTSGTPYFGAASLAVGEDPNTAATGPMYQLGWYTSGGQLAFHFTDPNGGASGLYTIGDGGTYNGFPDSTWHYLCLVLPGSNNIKSIVDANIGGLAGMGFTPSIAVALNNFYIDANTYFGDPLTSIAVANVAAYTYALSAAQNTAHYKRGTGYIGELSGARVTRLLTTYWAGTSSVAAGVSKLAPDFGYDGRAMLDVLQEIQETERGLLYVSRSGTVVFEDRATRYAAANQTPLWTIGENPPGASPTEYPYISYGGDYDPTYVFSQANLSRPGNSTVTPQINAAAQADYGQRIITQTLQVNSDFEVQQAGLYYLTRYGTPKVRLETIVLDPASNPALWPKVLSLEISQRLTVKRRTGALTTSNDYYVEQINHEVEPGSGKWTVSLQLSPVFVPTAWILGDSTYGVLGSTTVPVY